MGYNGRLVLPERAFPASENGAGSSVTGSPQRSRGPARSFASANPRLPNARRIGDSPARTYPREVYSPFSLLSRTRNPRERSDQPARCAVPDAGGGGAASVKESRLAARIPRRIVAKEWHSRHARKSDDGRGNCSLCCRLSRRYIPPIVSSSLESNQDQEKGNKVSRRVSRIRTRSTDDG